MNHQMNAAPLVGSADSVKAKGSQLQFALEGSAEVKGFIPPTEVAK